MKKFLSVGFMRTISFAVLLAGIAGSLAFVLYNGRNNKSVLLIVLFVIWVLSPFVQLLFTNKASETWKDGIRKALYSLILFITILSLVGYSGVLRPAGTRPAFVFQIVPLISWVLIAILLFNARSQSKRIAHDTEI